LTFAKEITMKSVTEPKILQGFLQDVDEIVLGSQRGEKTFFQRFMLLNKKVLENAPFHIATHLIKDLDSPPDPYVKVHIHPDYDEIGLIIAPKDKLQYEIILNGKVNYVTSPAAVYIPAGTSHRARALKGNGAYVCILMDPEGPSLENAVAEK
jgi:mannose-6-phosphate isomerase-like protein (cupin superfamily)